MATITGDPNVFLPDQVRKQQRDAEEMMRRIAKGEGEDTTQPLEGEDTLAGADGQDTIQPNEGQDTLDPNAGDDTISGDQGGDTTDALAQLQHQFDTLRGKYDAELPRLQQALDRANETIRRLEAKQNEPAAKPTPTTTSNGKRISQKDIDDVGPELFAIIQRAALDTVEPELERLRTENQQFKSQLGHVATTVRDDAADRFEAALDDRVSQWREINSSREFLDWLAQEDPLRGVPLQDMLDDAVKKLDADRVAVFVETYLAERGQAAQTPSTPSPARPGNTPATGRTNGDRVRLETLTSPAARAGTTTASQTQRGRIWTRDEINRFYSAKRRGQLTPEQVAMEPDIFAAQREGRVQ